MSALEHITRERFGELMDDDELLDIAGVGAFGEDPQWGGRRLDETKIAAALDHANRTIDGYVSGRAPKGMTAGVLEAAAADIARYRLYPNLGASKIADEVRARFKDAMQLLRDVQTGRYRLTDNEGVPIGVADGPGGTVMSSSPPERVPQALEGWL